LIEAHTERLRLVAGTLEIATAELEDRDRFGLLLEARVPPEWPPESVRFRRKTVLPGSLTRRRSLL